MKSRILNLSLIAIAVAALTACGGGDDNKTTTPTDSDPSKLTYSAFFETISNDLNTTATIKGDLKGSFESGTYTLTFTDQGDVFNQTATDDNINWNNAAGGGRSFLDAKALIACTSTGSKNTNIALRDAKEVDYKELGEKTFTGYSCGKEENAHSELDGLDILTTYSDGSAAIAEYELDPSLVAKMFSSEGLDTGDFTMRAKAYKIGDKYVIRISDVLVDDTSQGQILYIETTIE